MKWSKTSIAAVTAAAIDCDGSISIVRYKVDGGKKNPNYYVLITLQQNDGRLIDFLVGNWGGRVTREIRYSGYETNNTYTWRWTVKDVAAEKVLRKCVKYMHIKKEKALNALRFISFKKRIIAKYHIGSTPYPEYVWRKYEEYWNKSKELTKEIKDSRAGIETERQKLKRVSDSPTTQELVTV